VTAPTRFVTANGIRYAYRRFGAETFCGGELGGFTSYLAPDSPLVNGSWAVGSA